MITEEQKKAVKDLIQYVHNYCKEHNLDVLMVAASTDDQPNMINQMKGVVVCGNPNYISISISDVVKRDAEVAAMLLKVCLRGCKGEVGGKNPFTEILNMN